MHNWAARVRGAGNNGPAGTAQASSFLNCPGVRCGPGWSSAWPERGCRCRRVVGWSRRAGTVRPARRPARSL